jgi:hypothetical protein
MTAYGIEGEGMAFVDRCRHLPARGHFCAPAGTLVRRGLPRNCGGGRLFAARAANAQTADVADGGIGGLHHPDAAAGRRSNLLSGSSSDVRTAAERPRLCVPQI